MMRPAQITKRQPRCGTATVEFAVLAPLLVFLFMISVDFARLYYHYVTLDGAARNAALWLADPKAATESQWTGSTGYQGAAQADATNLSNPGINVGTPVAGTAPDGSKTWTVTVTYPFSPYITNFPWSPLPSTITLSRTVQVRELLSVPPA